MATWLDVDDLDHAYRAGVAGRLVRWLQRPHPRRADVVSYHHPLLRAHLVDDLSCAPDRTLAVPQGVHVRRFARPRDPLSTYDGRPRVVFAAHLNLACDLDVLLEAWPAVLAHHPCAVLTVVGSGSRLRGYRRTVRDRRLGASVDLVGRVRPEEVAAYLAGADAAVVWSTDRLVNRHRCSLKLREYLAAGLPVVCNDVGELADFATVTYQVSGGPADLAAELARVLDGRGDGREAAGRRLATSLDWSPIVARAAAEVAARCGLTAPRRRPEPESQHGPASPPVAVSVTTRARGDEPVPSAAPPRSGGQE
jgi:glycosyltransferase involved in cell wall biosynthesis